MIRIDEPWRAVYVDEVEVGLTPAEYHALMVLVSSPGVHSYTEIATQANAVWPKRWTDKAAHDWAKTYMKRLRDKLGAEAIVSRRGFGWGLVVEVTRGFAMGPE